MARRLRGSILGATLLICGACVPNTAASDLPALSLLSLLTSPGVTLTNVRSGSFVATGFLTGTVSSPTGRASVEISIDGGPFVPATGTTTWRFALPTGANTWRLNSLHTLQIRRAGVGNPVTTVTLRKDRNRDVNGDGYPDAAFGAQGSGGGGRGQVFVFHGSATGVGTADLGAGGQAAATLTGDPASNLGWSPVFADVNGDGYADLIMGANSFNGNQGRAYVMHGSASGIPTRDFGSTAADATLTGVTAPNTAFFGRAVAAGDINGDGYDDVAVGAQVHSGSQGQTFVFHGSSSGITTTDLSAGGSANTVITGEAAAHRMGPPFTSRT